MKMEENISVKQTKEKVLSDEEINKELVKISEMIMPLEINKAIKQLKEKTNYPLTVLQKQLQEIKKIKEGGNKTLPRCEYEKTRSFLRVLWKLFKPYREKTKNEPGLGILVSDILTDFHPKELKIQSGMIGKPLIEIMQWKKWLKKPQWQQNIIKIGKEKRYG